MEARSSVKVPNMQDLAAFALTARVFGRDLVVLLRWAAAASVRVGVSELQRADRERGQR